MDSAEAKTVEDLRGELVTLTGRIFKGLDAVANAVEDELAKDNPERFVAVARVLAVELERRVSRANAKRLGVTDDELDGFLGSLRSTLVNDKTGERIYG